MKGWDERDGLTNLKVSRSLMVSDTCFRGLAIMQVRVFEKVAAMVRVILSEHMGFG